MSCTRRMPATSGIVSMSKTSSGIIDRLSRGPSARDASRGKDACRQLAVAAVADDEDDRRVRDAVRHAQRDRAGAARADAAEDAFLAREAARRVLGIGLRDVLGAVDAARIEDLRR